MLSVTPAAGSPTVGKPSRIGSAGEMLDVLEWFRYVWERLVVVPAAGYLPLRVALAAAWMAGFFDYVIPTRTGRTMRAEIAAATGKRGWAGFRLACERLAMPRRGLVTRRRFRGNRERMSDWKLIETNGEAVRELVAASSPFIVAGGHFAPVSATFLYRVIPPDTSSVGGEMPRWRLAPASLRRRLTELLGDGLRWRMLGIPRPADSRIGVPNVWVGPTDWRSLPRRLGNAQERMLEELSRPGSHVKILVDAFWDKPGAYRRPFAGMNERGFALGAARVARLAQCPIVPYVAVPGARYRTIQIDWSDPIMPPPVDDRSADERTLDQALAFIERGIGRYPTQYDHRIGYDRTWNSALQSWEDASG